MMEEPQSIPLEDVNRAIDLIIDTVDKRFGLMEERVETLEQLHGKLAIAYAELASSVELLIAEVMSPRSDEDKEKFRRDIQERFQETLNLLQKATNESARRDPKNYVDEAVARMAEKREDNTSDG